MSVHESVFLIQKSKAEKFFEIAHLKPIRFMTVAEQIELEKQEGNAQPALTVRLVTDEERATPEFKETQRHYKKVWDYIYKNGEQPFKFDWSGAALCEVLSYLFEEKKICLCENTVAEAGREFQWHILDSKSKRDYLQELNPDKYSKAQLKQTFEQRQMEQQKKALAEMQKMMTPEKIKEAEEIFGKEQAKEILSFTPRIEEFPERGEALLDGIKYFHSYLERVDDDTIVLFHIG